MPDHDTLSAPDISPQGGHAPRATVNRQTLPSHEDPSHAVSALSPDWVMDQVPDPIWVKDLDGRYLYANPATCRLLLGDVSPEAVLGLTEARFGDELRRKGQLHTFDRSGRSSDLEVAEKLQSGRYVEEGFVRGRYLQLEVHKSPLLDGDGGITGILSSAREMTKDGAVIHAPHQGPGFRKLAESLPVPIIEHDLKGGILNANAMAAKWFGREMVRRGETIWPLVPEDLTPRVRELMGRVRQGKSAEPLNVRYEMPGRQERYCAVYPVALCRDGVAEGVLACFIDLTDHQRAQAALEESESRFRALFNNFQDSIFIHPCLDSDYGCFVEVNDMACLHYGYSRRAFETLTPNDLMASDQTASGYGESVRQSILKHGRGVFEGRHRTRDGQVFPVEISSSVMEFQGKRFFLTAVRDITQRKQRDAELEAASLKAAEQEKYALVGQVARKMAHDFNNILGGIMGNAELSLMDSTQPEVQENLKIIRQQTLRGRRLTKNLVAFARNQEPREVLVDPNQAVESVLNLMKKDLAEIRVVRDYGAKVPDLMGDPEMIEHALVNLVQNAVHAMARRSDPCLTVGSRHYDRRVDIWVGDNGCGIPEEHLNDIFIPSFTLKGSRDTSGVYGPGIQGTGYGMANVKKYVEKHQGWISVTSREGVGSQFILSFPLKAGPRAAAPAELSSEAPLIRGKRVLLVEDDGAISWIQEQLLGQSPLDHGVVLARTGEKAVRAYDRGEFDIVSLDYVLPGPMNGLDVYHYIRSRDPWIPILFVSGNMNFLNSLADLKARDPHLAAVAKPCENQAYVRALNDLLMKRAAPDACEETSDLS